VRIRALRSRILEAPLAWSAVFVGALLLLLQPPAPWWSEAPLPAGEIAAHDVVARVDFDVLDAELTDARRHAAEEAVPDVYVLDTQRGARLTAEVASYFESRRRSRDGTDAKQYQEPARTASEREAGFVDYAPAAEAIVALAVARSQSGPVVGNRALLAKEPAILVVRSPAGGESLITALEQILDLDAARARTRAEVVAKLDPVYGDIAASFVDANLAFDPDGTAQRRRNAGESVLPVRIHVPAGTRLVHAGERITPEAARALEAEQAALAPTTGVVPFAAVFVLLVLLAFFLQRYARYHQRGFRKLEGLHALLVQVLVATLLLGQALLWVAGKLADDFGSPFDRVESYPYLIPVGAGAILVALLANGRIAIVYSAYAAILYGALTGWDAYHALWAFVAQLAGVYAVTSYRERAALLRAGLVTGGAAAVAAAALELLRRGDEPAARAMLAGTLALLGGALGVGLLLSFVLPLFERMFNVLTDVRLLELSNVNHPLLAELAQKAPGSYSHSLVVGTLAQEAAKAVGANPLFCRVAAFYHDIGKVLKPEYYVENQQGTNPHDQLTPSMSALVLAAHVKDGVRMAREAGLPEQIIDIIPQHHGTRVMTYFLDKARRSTDPMLQYVREEEFRYPGPKPRTPEAAIFMLADAVEAAARAVNDPTPDRLRAVIRQVTDAVVLDRQLDECDLTFADLERIQDAFLTTLLGTHHHRPEYPGFSFGPSEKAIGDAVRRRA